MTVRSPQVGIVLAFALLAFQIVVTPETADGRGVKVTVQDGKTVAAVEPVLPLDPDVRIAIGSAGSLYYGLSIDGKRICCSPQGSIWPQFRINGNVIQPNFNVVAVNQFAMMKQKGKPEPIIRDGSQGTLDIKQILEVVPSKAIGMVKGDGKRKMDTCLATYVVWNKGNAPTKFELRVSIDMMVNNNDGALFASPSTQPRQVLDGVELRGKKFPEYLHCLENANYESPGMVATMSFKAGKGIGPDRIVLTNLGQIGQGWDTQPVNANGDSAVSIYWPLREIGAGEKVEFTWAYGGGQAIHAENEGRVAVSLGGSFEPNKLFTIQAEIQDALPHQTLRLELPEGLERVEGKELQTVSPAAESASSFVLWKARVLKMGEHQIRVRSNTGVTQIKTLKIEPVVD